MNIYNKYLSKFIINLLLGRPHYSFPSSHENPFKDKPWRQYPGRTRERERVRERERERERLTEREILAAHFIGLGK